MAGVLIIDLLFICFLIQKSYPYSFASNMWRYMAMCDDYSPHLCIASYNKGITVIFSLVGIYYRPILDKLGNYFAFPLTTDTDTR